MNQAYLKLTLSTEGTMDSDHEFIHDAIDRIFPSNEGVGLIRKKKEIFLRLDGITIELQALSRLKNETQAIECDAIESDTFWQHA